MSESSDIKRFFDAEEKYFKAGGELTITYVDNDELDYSQMQNQNKLHRLDRALQDCIGCKQSWHLRQSLRSWFDDFNNWVSGGECPLVTPAIVPG